jgi:hypothetical protein
MDKLNNQGFKIRALHQTFLSQIREVDMNTAAITQTEVQKCKRLHWEKPGREIRFKKPTLIYNDNIKSDLTEIGCLLVD